MGFTSCSEDGARKRQEASTQTTGKTKRSKPEGFDGGGTPCKESTVSAGKIEELRQKEAELLSRTGELADFGKILVSASERVEDMPDETRRKFMDKVSVTYDKLAENPYDKFAERSLTVEQVNDAYGRMFSK